MRKLLLAGTSSFALALGASAVVGLSGAAHAGEIVTMPNGQVIEVNEDGSWDPVPASSPEAATAEPVTVVPAAGPALPYVSGVLSLWAGASILDSDNGDFDAPAAPIFGGDARMAGEAWQMEVLGSFIGTTSTTGGTQNTDGSTYFAGVVHGLMRDVGDSGNITLGAFLGADSVKFVSSDEGTVNLYPGLEAALFSDAQTFYGQVGGAVCVTGECTDGWRHGVFGRAGIRHFLSPSQKLEADFLVGWGYFDSTANDSFNFGWGLEYERQISGSPFGIFAAYNGTYVEEGNVACTSCDVFDHALRVGVRIHLGPDLQTEYTKGASVFNFPGHYLQRFTGYPDEL